MQIVIKKNFFERGIVPVAMLYVLYRLFVLLPMNNSAKPELIVFCVIATLFFTYATYIYSFKLILGTNRKFKIEYRILLYKYSKEINLTSCTIHQRNNCVVIMNGKKYWFIPALLSQPSELLRWLALQQAKSEKEHK